MGSECRRSHAVRAEAKFRLDYASLLATLRKRVHPIMGTVAGGGCN